MSDHAILRAYFEELLERLGEGDHVLAVVGSPAVEQLNRAAGSLGLQPPISLRHLKRRPGQGRSWIVSDPAASEVADVNDYDAIVVDILDPFSNEEVRRIVIAAGHRKICEANPDARSELRALLRRWVKFLAPAPGTPQPGPAPAAPAAPPSADDLKAARGQAITLLYAAAGVRSLARGPTRDSRQPAPDDREQFVESAGLLRQSYFAVAPEDVPVRDRQWEKLRPYWELDGEQITDAGQTDRTAHDLVLHLAAETLAAVGTLIAPGDRRDLWEWDAAMAEAAALPAIDRHKLDRLLHREHDRGLRRIASAPAAPAGKTGLADANQSVGSPTTAVPAYKLGDLIRDLEGLERAYAQTKAAADRKAAVSPVEAKWWYAQAEANRWRPDPRRMPGIERIELLCDEDGGGSVTVESIRRLRARVCRQAGILPNVADQLDLNAVADLVGAAGELVSQSAPAATPTSWTDPNKCPNCGGVPPDWVQFAQHYDCPACGWRLNTGKMMMPVGKAGAPPAVVQTHGPYWEPRSAAVPPMPAPPSSWAELADQAGDWMKTLHENRDAPDAERLSRLPRFNSLWEDMHRLGVRGFPDFPGEPATVANALDMLRSVIRLCRETHEWVKQVNDAMDNTLAGGKAGGSGAIGAGVRQAGNREPLSSSDLPAFLSAADLAKATRLNKAALDTALRRYAGDHPDCRNEQENPRPNEPKFLYRVADVWPVVQKLLAKRR